MDEALKDIANLQIGQELGRLAEERQRAIQLGTNAAAARGNLNPAFRIDIEVEYASKFASVISDTWIELFEGKYGEKLTREQVDFVKKEIATVLDARKSSGANFPGIPQSAGDPFQGELARRLESVKARACTALEVRFRKQEAGVQASPVVRQNATTNHLTVIADSRLAELRALSSTYFDFKKLIRICEEINTAYSEGCYFATAMLTRGLLDHVPPIFGKNSFGEVANNYTGGGRSFKEAMHHLEHAARRVADAHLHMPIRKSETLPVAQQVNFSPQLDVLLSEIVRITR